MLLPVRSYKKNKMLLNKKNELLLNKKSKVLLNKNKVTLNKYKAPRKKSVQKSQRDRQHGIVSRGASGALNSCLGRGRDTLGCRGGAQAFRLQPCLVSN